MKSPRSVSTSWGLALTLFGTATILALTLWPSQSTGPRNGFWCLFCGSRDLADAFLNLLLFIPFGAGVSALAGGVLAAGTLAGGTLAAMASLSLSGIVELAQTGLAGRHPSLEDLIFNTAGGLLGALLLAGRIRLVRGIFFPSGPTRAAALIAPVVIFGLSALLSQPRVPQRDLYGQWTHELGSMIPYPGQILSARVGDIAVPDARLQDSPSLRAALLAGKPLSISLIAGPEPETLSHLFAIYDDEQQEVLLFSVQGTDLFFQYRTLSWNLLLDQPFLRWPGIMRTPPGDTVEVTLSPSGRRPCLRVADRVRCDLVAGVEGGWALVHRLRMAPPWFRTVLEVLWLIGLSLPAGFVSLPTARATVSGIGALGLGLGFTGSAISWLAPWHAFHWVQLWAPALGVAAGVAARSFLAPRLAPSSTHLGRAASGADPHRSVAPGPQRVS